MISVYLENSTALMLIMAILATYRVAHMVVRENGPADIFIRLRHWVHGRFFEKKGHWIYDGINCVHCVSFWVALLVAVALPQAGVTLGPTWLVWLAISGSCTLVNLFLYGR